MFYSLDRFEGEYAVMVSDSGGRVNILKSHLQKAEEGAIYELFDGEFRLNPTETAVRREKAKSLFEDLFKS